MLQKFFRFFFFVFVGSVFLCVSSMLHYMLYYMLTKLYCLHFCSIICPAFSFLERSALLLLQQKCKLKFFLLLLCWLSRKSSFSVRFAGAIDFYIRTPELKIRSAPDLSNSIGFTNSVNFEEN